MKAAARRLIGDLQRKTNGGSPDSRNEGFSPELVVRGTPHRPAAARQPTQAGYLTLSVCPMKRATLSCSCFSDASCAYTMCPDGYHA